MPHTHTCLCVCTNKVFRVLLFSINKSNLIQFKVFLLKPCTLIPVIGLLLKTCFKVIFQASHQLPCCILLPATSNLTSVEIIDSTTAVDSDLNGGIDASCFLNSKFSISKTGCQPWFKIPVHLAI